MLSVMRGGVRVSVTPLLLHALLSLPVSRWPRARHRPCNLLRSILSRPSLCKHLNLLSSRRLTIAHPTKKLVSHTLSGGWRMGTPLGKMGLPRMRSRWRSLATTCRHPETATAY